MSIVGETVIYNGSIKPLVGMLAEVTGEANGRMSLSFRNGDRAYRVRSTSVAPVVLSVKAPSREVRVPVVSNVCCMCDQPIDFLASSKWGLVRVNGDSAYGFEAVHSSSCIPLNEKVVIDHPLADTISIQSAPMMHSSEDTVEIAFFKNGDLVRTVLEFEGYESDPEYYLTYGYVPITKVAAFLAKWRP